MQRQACKRKRGKTRRLRQSLQHNSLQAETKKQKQLQEGQLRPADLSSEQKLEQRGENKRRGTKACTSQPQGEPNQLLRRRWCRTAAPQATACNKNSLGIGAQERPPKRPWRILVDTGAELSVAPRSFAANTQLSPCEKDLQLRTANGIAIQTFGMRTVQLLCQGFSFTMSFVIADVEQPLLGLSSLLRHNLSLHLDSNLGHHLGNTAGEKIQLEQRGRQIYLVACPTELGLTHCMIGNLLDNSLSPEAKNLGHEVSLDKGVLDEGGATSFSLGHKQHKPTKNKTAIGQQTALPRAKLQKQKGQQKAVSKLRTQQKTRFTEKIQLALLDPEDPRSILDEQASKDLSLRILLTLSLMKKWQLTTTRIRTASPPQLTKNQLRELGLKQSVVDSQIFVGWQLCVMLHEHVMLIGGEKLQQEDFLNKLSACMPLEDTRQLDDKTPVNFMGRSLEHNRAERSISLHLPSAFYLQLLRRCSSEDATSRDSPRDELENEAPRWNNMILDAEKTELYRQTVGDLQWSSLSRPDISFAVQQLSNSFVKPTESHEDQLVNLLRHLKGTQHYSISLQPPRRWMKAKNLELLAFSSVSWSGACRSISGLSLSFMGVPLATSATRQATSTKAAELESVRMACTQAIHTESLLQDLQLVQPIALRVLTGGPLAEQLGLSRNNRHLHLLSWFGQFQLSKVGSQQNLAASLTNNLTASGLHRLLPKLRMHTRSADALALSTELGSGPASFGVAQVASS